MNDLPAQSISESSQSKHQSAGNSPPRDKQACEERAPGKCSSQQNATGYSTSQQSATGFPSSQKNASDFLSISI
ncbi:hypothetical protein DPMN_140441 [Dreissena polymorpha]|uniref:Uncharacterized protein n=1 Tax=Dreissena polymorpha TaxID=45954 RepID=A0A9D4G7L4_DREPO|nr:hypothetical protein DPMN_140441 [Dreissena polymorpha]